jgi:hypothetical protein
MNTTYVTTTGAAYAAADAGFLAGASLRAAAAAATATITETVGGRTIAILSAPVNGADHFMPARPVPYKGALTVTLSGAGADALLFQA